ncbi:MAG: ABC transporter substrate-binding protein [Synergistaceae bacterium]|nr:ABC transporter substrate-binding protein [Synergistaceae bacterium]
MGEDVVIDGRASRIISFYAGHTENLMAIGAKDSIIAIGHEPGDIGLSVPVLGAKPGIEQILAQNPDVVLTRPMMARSQKPLYDALKSFGVRVLAFDPPEWDGLPKYVMTLWSIAGTGEMPENFVSEAMAASGGAYQERAMGVFLVTNGRTMATCTEGSWAAHIMRLAGFRNAAAGAVPLASGSVVAGFGVERLLASDGEIDAILLQQGAMNTTTAADFMSDPRFAALRAVREGMVFDVAEADISRPSLLRLENGVVRSLHEMVYSRRAGR